MPTEEEHFHAVRDFENTFFRGKRIADTDAYKAAKQQASFYYDDLVTKFGTIARNQLIALFDKEYRKSILDFNDRMQEFATSTSIQMALKFRLILAFYTDAFELVCKEIQLLVRQQGDRSLKCGDAHNRLRDDGRYKPKYDAGLAIWFDYFLRNAVGHVGTNIDPMTGDMEIWNDKGDGVRIKSDNQPGTEIRNILEYYDKSLHLTFFLYAAGNVFWERGRYEVRKPAST
ncbi:MAG: hypothetical protein JRN20_22850 [Nitrososphaerota archaeon]|nr:hypothetical protein [Nitrososphaerota archaeon]